MSDGIGNVVKEEMNIKGSISLRCGYSHAFSYLKILGQQMKSGEALHLHAKGNIYHDSTISNNYYIRG
jgi:hypothetical protein